MGAGGWGRRDGDVSNPLVEKPAIVVYAERVCVYEKFLSLSVGAVR